MGTNYYWIKEGRCKDPCQHCRGPQKFHIGKSSGGWVFALHAIPEDGIHDLSDWENRWDIGIIKNEYDEIISPEEMKSIIIDRCWERDDGVVPDDKFLKDNHAVMGPKGLIRIDISRVPYVSHGMGTWDLHQGDFS